MSNNFLQLNSNKTEALLVGTPHQVQSCPISHLTFDGQLVPFSPSVTNLGVKFDPHLTFNTHINHLCRTAFYHLKNISKLRPLLTLPDAEKLVHAFISSRLDYCNGLFIGKVRQKLQYIQNSAARVLMRVRKYHHISPIHFSLHWLPVSATTVFQLQNPGNCSQLHKLTPRVQDYSPWGTRQEHHRPQTLLKQASKHILFI